ncbi:DUF2309 domain-containing protein [Vibrio nitrifigilis]|uniref:Probable inorganic carbon transporter subunit DabA n=1 Tax=Vibrio nitrifigilis TaxID=2789781 RepID=A0ABS0GI19_9VIBR|nr:DUF2309 domain-containing protein [Vibrio nitrifigilis]MBF9002044.1 DUF2309 domain-containing protein [Vibrio nitrifigilis]
MILEKITLPFANIAQQASESIAPAWPLDQSIAVNPWWPQRHSGIEQTFAEQAVITGITGLMEKKYFQAKWKEQIQPEHVEQAIKDIRSPLTNQEVQEYIERQDKPLPRWETLAMLMDDNIPSEQGHSWGQEIQQQVSQFIALYHQYPERFDAEGKNGEHLYQSWLEVVTRDKGIRTLIGVDLLPYFGQLPTSIEGALELFQTEWQELLQNEHGSLAFMKASLHQLSGWAGWQSWLDWQAGLNKQEIEIPHTLGLSVILLAWDYVLWQWLKKEQQDTFVQVRQTMQSQAANVTQYYELAKQQLEPRWVWQRAFELSVHAPWIEQVKHAQEVQAQTRPQIQAIFCIDVRSEPMRRALEAQGSEVETLGFTGFFGIPMSYQNQDGSIKRPQLPGLLAPNLVAQQTKMQPDRWLRLTKLGWQNSLEKPSSNLGMVEAGGLLKLVSLFKRVVMQQGTENPVNRDARTNDEWDLKRNEVSLTTAEKAELGAGVLKAMGISQRLANVVLLAGHGSQTCNNHTSSSLDCGACGGQSGEVNAKVLASILNDPEVRALTPEFGVTIPEDTQFYAAIHNTTTDELQVFKQPKECDWAEKISAACDLARIKRVKQFDTGNDEPSPQDVSRFFKQRANNWAQMRPEWGLCNNAGVFIAPRALTRSMDLDGRSFLHEYHADQDPEFKQLENIMTAPLLVMNWINLQYFASVTAPTKYGSGNKLLHNVVGGHIGVFEGNGGDLRIGLSQQSVHDGKQYRHQPIRLSAFIQAPKTAIEDIINKHDNVSSLVDNGWLFLYHIDDNHQVSKYQDQQWLPQ